MENAEEPVQNKKKKRSQSDKFGRHKWNQTLLKCILDKLEKIEAKKQVILNGLKGAGYFKFKVLMIQKCACVDAVDLNIVEVVREAGAKGFSQGHG